MNFTDFGISIALLIITIRAFWLIGTLTARIEALEKKTKTKEQS